MPGFLWVLIIIFVIYFLIIRPLTRSSDPYSRSRSGPFPLNSPQGGLGRGLGMLAGGFAAGSLLTWLLEEGRIDLDQYDLLQELPQDELLQQLDNNGIISFDEAQSVIQDLGTQADAAQNTDYLGYDTGDDFRLADYNNSVSSDSDDDHLT